MSGYMTASALYSILGFVAGLTTGLLLSNTRGPLRPDPREGRMVRRNRVLGLCLLLFAAFTVLQGLNQSQIQSRVAECQSDWTSEVLEAIRQRAVFTEQDRTNLNGLVRSLDTSGSREQRAAVLRQYLEIQRRIDQERAQYQYPARPDCR